MNPDNVFPDNSKKTKPFAGENRVFQVIETVSVQ